MKWLSGFSWLSAWRRGAAHRFTEDDTDGGDMGTAFGLDAIQDDYAPLHPSAPAANSDDWAPAARWQARLNGRSGL